MEHLHIRLPAELKLELKKHCRDNNIAVTSAIIIMINNELSKKNLAGQVTNQGDKTDPSLGFFLWQ